MWRAFLGAIFRVSQEGRGDASGCDDDEGVGREKEFDEEVAFGAAAEL